MLVRTLILLLTLGGSPAAAGQTQATAADNLATGIRQMNANDFFRALLTLNEAAGQLAAQPGEAELLARVHAYRALVLTRLDQPERARAAVRLALEAKPDMAPAAGEFTPALVMLFDEARRPAAADPEGAGRAAEQSGRFQDAFRDYLAAYRALADPAPPADDQRLRERIITVVRRLDTAPLVPAEAREHATTADRLLEAEAILGTTGGASMQAAAIALRKAIRLAPWWPEATFKLATAAQRLQRVDEALLNLNLYRLADPDGYAASIAKATPAITPAEPVVRTAIPRPLGPAMIYVYWPEQQRGSKRQKLFCNGQQVADLQKNRFVVLKAAPGSHDLAFRDKHVTAVVEAGHEYHYRASLEGHWQFAQGPELRLTLPDAAKEEMRKQEMRLNDARRTRSAECAALAAPGVRRRF